MSFSSSSTSKLTHEQWEILDYFNSNPYSSTAGWSSEDIKTTIAMKDKYLIQSSNYPPRYCLNKIGSAFFAPPIIPTKSVTPVQVGRGGAQVAPSAKSLAVQQEKNDLIDDIRSNLRGRIYYNITNNKTDDMKLTSVNIRNLAEKFSIRERYCHELFHENGKCHFRDLVVYDKEQNRWFLIYPLNHQQVVSYAETHILFHYGLENAYNVEFQLDTIQTLQELPLLSMFKPEILTRALHSIEYARLNPDHQFTEVNDNALLTDRFVQGEIEEVIYLYYESAVYDLEEIYNLENMFFSRSAIETYLKGNISP
jgi:hypothetical protein